MVIYTIDHIELKLLRLSHAKAFPDIHFIFIFIQMNHLYIRYRDLNGNIIDHPEPYSDIVIFDAGQYDYVYINIGEMRDDVPYLNRMKYWDLRYYESEFPEEKLPLIKESLLDIVTREFCTMDYKITEEMEQEYDWFAKYHELKQRLKL